jgi:hypothetical protein
MLEGKATAKYARDICIINVLPESGQNFRVEENYDLLCCIGVDPSFEVFPYRSEI